MRSASLFAVAVLAVVLVVSSFSPVAAAGYIDVYKVTTNGDDTTEFPFEFTGPLVNLKGGETYHYLGPFGTSETVTEQVPPGWHLTNINCYSTVLGSTTQFDYNTVPNGVVITFDPSLCSGGVCADMIVCTFTNSPVSPPVGGVVIPANNFAIVAPWLVIIGLVGCIGTVVVVAKKRRP